MAVVGALHSQNIQMNSCNYLILFLLELLLGPGNIEQGLDFGEELPPLPVSEEEVLAHIALEHCNGQSVREESWKLF